MPALTCSEMRALAPGNKHVIVARRAALQQHLQDDVDAAVAAGRFTTAYPREAVRSVVGMCIQTGQWYDVGGALRPEQLAERIVGVALDTMAYHPRERSSA